MALLTHSYAVDAAIVLLGLLFAVYKYFTWDFDYWKRRGVPYVKPQPFFGNFKDVVMLKAPIGAWLFELYKKMDHLDFFGIWVFGTPHFIVKSPELIRKILVKDFNYFQDRTIVNDENADPMGSKVIFMLKNPDWKPMRAKLSPVFTSGKIKGMIPLMNIAAEDMKAYLLKAVAAGGTIEAKEVCAKFTTDIVTSCAFGVEAQSFKHENAAFRDIGRKMFDYRIKNAIRGTSYFFAPAIVSFFKLTFFDPEVNKFCRKAFWETIHQREEIKNKRNDLIDIIIEMRKTGNFDGIKFEGDTVVAQALQFFAAGFETTSSTIGFTLYELCLQPNIQTKLRKEIISALNESNGEVTYDLIKDMKYLDKVVKETLRKYPVLPFLDRRCMKDYKIEGTDVVIEKGTPVYIPMFGLHYDPKYFPDPEKYDPERFSEENVKTRPAYSYIPFGDGPHNCIGERFALISTKLGLIQILSNFCLEATPETPVPIIFESKSFVLQSTVGLPMKFISYNRRLSAAA